jgi:hypothetical protein
VQRQRTDQRVRRARAQLAFQPPVGQETSHRMFASTPSMKRLPCAAWPCVVTSIQLKPLCARRRSSAVASVTIARRRGSAARWPPCQTGVLLVGDGVTSRSPRKRTPASLRLDRGQGAAGAPFMWAPRAGAVAHVAERAAMPATPTVSTCPLKHQAAPPWPPTAPPRSRGPARAPGRRPQVEFRPRTDGRDLASPGAPGTTAG